MLSSKIKWNKAWRECDWLQVKRVILKDKSNESAWQSDWPVYTKKKATLLGDLKIETRALEAAFHNQESQTEQSLSIS